MTNLRWFQFFRQLLRRSEPPMAEPLKRTAESDAGPEAKKARMPKRKVAVQIGYCGTGYHGMQLNPPNKTIEGDLFAAMVAAGAISADNADDPKKSSFIRAARTDKGVHAAGNVVSLKMIIEDPEIVNKINDNLPEQIRVWGFSRTNRAFECRRACSSRIYEYILPTYTLMSPSAQTLLGQRMADAGRFKCDNSVLAKEADSFWESVSAELTKQGITEETVKKLKLEITEEDESEEKATIKAIKTVENKHRRAYRADPERIAKFRETLQGYSGVNNFHNFTVGKAPTDPSSTRIMRSLTVSDPFVINGTEWVSVKIHGQSFMLHQIRKMIALAVLIVRTNSTPAKVKTLFNHDKVSIPKAPALGLLLERPIYDAYNQRLGKLGLEPITFDPYNEQIDAFKQKFVYNRIYAQEAQENEFHSFFGYMDTYRVAGLLDFLLDIRSDPIPDAPEAVNDSESDNEENNEDNEG